MGKKGGSKHKKKGAKNIRGKSSLGHKLEKWSKRRQYTITLIGIVAGLLVGGGGGYAIHKWYVNNTNAVQVDTNNGTVEQNTGTYIIQGDYYASDSQTAKVIETLLAENAELREQIKKDPTREAELDRNEKLLALWQEAEDSYERQDYEKAIECLNSILEITPDDVGAYNNRGIAFCLTDKYTESLPDFTEAIELEPNFAGAYYNRGNAYRNLNQYDEAIEDYNEAIELAPSNADAYINRGAVYWSLGEYKKAEADFTEVIDLDPNAWDAYNNRGAVYLELGQYDDAIVDYTKAIDLKPNLANAYEVRAFLYDKLGETALAQQDRETYARLTNTN